MGSRGKQNRVASKDLTFRERNFRYRIPKRGFGKRRNNLEPAENPPTNWSGATSGRRLRLMGNSKGRDNAKKRARRRKKTERLALGKKKKAAK